MKMAAQKPFLATIFLILITFNPVDPCNRLNSPCPTNRCCHLVFNIGVLSYSFCRRRNRNDSKCAQDDYCLIDSDCGAGGKCEGATAFAWGRCSGTSNPCLKPKT